MIHFDKNLVFNSAKFPSCTEAQVRTGAAACAKAKVGSGKAAGLALGQQQDLAVTAYNGPGGKAVLLHVTGSKPLKIDSVIVGKLSPDSGAFGRKLVVSHPGQPPAAARRRLRHADLVRDERSAAAPRARPTSRSRAARAASCKFKGDFVFTDGSKQSPTSTTACTK